jgi:uncharacterized membrane protein SirB2
MSVLFFGFSFSPHILTILPNISGSIVLAGGVALFLNSTQSPHDSQSHDSQAHKLITIVYD